ncbi:hypothetical protein ASF10_13250 [Flavobacterium sp. Leaf82]|uniref:hypothetical protein n=1 Tax=unclassified Flavobacterium TaxID=196869 RepID=UPI0007146353|nr:hypothetical protein [Flavobacterium sp. Leaf82]KQO21710.1 hypothetical protein ASF10_13250 [Flavobacterium sp. Leaf82]
MFRDRFGRNRNPFDKDDFMNNDIWKRKDAIGEMLEARKSKNSFDHFSSSNNFFADGPNRRATEGELYFESKDNTIYRGNRDGSWTKATQLSEVVVKHLVSIGIKSDGIRVFGFGADPIAGSGNIKNDRGSGSIDTPGHDFNTCFDLGNLLGKLFPKSSLMFPWLLELEMILKYGIPDRQPLVTKNATLSDPDSIRMPLYHYEIMEMPNNDPQVAAPAHHDTTVIASERNIINKMNEENFKKMEEKAKLLPKQ